MEKTVKYPFYIRLAFTLICLICITYIMYVGKSVLVPILMAFLFAVLLLPINNFLHYKFRFPNTLAASITLLLFVVAIFGILAFLSYQIADIASDFALIKTNVNLFITDVHRFIKTNFNISIWEQRKYIEDVTQDSVKKGKETIGATLISVSNTILDLTLIPIYTFLILLYRTHFMVFFTKLFRKEYHPKLQQVLGQVKKSVQSYISGLIIEMIVVAVLTSIGLYFIGVEYYILLGFLTGILNLIPYIGILIAGILTILASLTGTPDVSLIMSVIVVNVIVQIIDNNVLVPLIINTKVQINAFVSIIGIIVGGGLAGIAGMFLAIPILAIVKIIFDNTDSMEAWGYLMGDNVPKGFIWRHNKKQSNKPKPIIATVPNESLDPASSETTPKSTNNGIVQ